MPENTLICCWSGNSHENISLLPPFIFFFFFGSWLVILILFFTMLWTYIHLAFSSRVTGKVSRSYVSHPNATGNERMINVVTMFANCWLTAPCTYWWFPSLGWSSPDWEYWNLRGFVFHFFIPVGSDRCIHTFLHSWLHLRLFSILFLMMYYSLNIFHFFHKLHQQTPTPRWIIYCRYPPLFSDFF